MIVNAGQPLKNLIKLAYRANQPLLMVGRHGVGKSELVAAAAEEMGVGHIVRDLSLMEPPDLAGLPVVEGGTMRYVAPSFLPTQGQGLLALEELNRAQRYLQAPCLQLLTARCLNDYELPPGWLPVACINPCDDGYTTDELDAALTSRFLQVEVEADVGEWLKWALLNRVDGRVSDYVSTLPKFSDEASPRSFAYASNILRAAEADRASESTVLAALAGVVGEEHALALLAFAAGDERPAEAEAIVERYPSIRPSVLRWKEQGRLDLLDASLHRLKVRLQSATNWAAVAETPAHNENVRQFITDLPGDIRRKAQKFLRENDCQL